MKANREFRRDLVSAVLGLCPCASYLLLIGGNRGEYIAFVIFCLLRFLAFLMLAPLAFREKETESVVNFKVVASCYVIEATAVLLVLTIIYKNIVLLIKYYIED